MLWKAFAAFPRHLTRPLHRELLRLIRLSLECPLGLRALRMRQSLSRAQHRKETVSPPALRLLRMMYSSEEEKLFMLRERLRKATRYPAVPRFLRMICFSSEKKLSRFETQRPLRRRQCSRSWSVS
jgi:hypothetical protein